MEQQPILCPICKSQSLSANRETFNNTRAAIGSTVLGTQQGLLHGSMGPKKVIITCLSCGHEFKPGEGATEDNFEEKNAEAIQKIEDIKTARENKRLFAFLLLVIIVFVLIWLFNSI